MDTAGEPTENDIETIRLWLADIRLHVNESGELDREGQDLVEGLAVYMTDRDLYAVEVDGKIVDFDIRPVQVVRCTIVVSDVGEPTYIERMISAERFVADDVSSPTLLDLGESNV